MPKSKKQDEQITELTADLQRLRADFENYRKQVEREKALARDAGQSTMVLKLLPVIDTLDRAAAHLPDHLADDKWAQGVVALTKQLDKQLEALGVRRIAAQPGTPFNPEFHEAIQFDDDAEGEHEIIAEELQAGYLLGDTPIRHAMVKVTKQ